MRRDQNYYINEIYPNISKKPLVFTGDTSMLWNGYSVSGIYLPTVLTDIPELKGMWLAGYVNYCYVPVVDSTNYVRSFMDNPMILIPSPERAVVENIKYDLEFVDEGYFCDALERFQHSPAFDLSKMKEVAEFYEVPMDRVEYWINESSDYNSY